MGDFNRDGKTDIVSGSVNRVAILLGNGDETFKPAVHYAAGIQPYGVTIADFNGDGKLDIASGSWGSSG